MSSNRITKPKQQKRRSARKTSSERFQSFLLGFQTFGKPAREPCSGCVSGSHVCVVKGSGRCYRCAKNGEKGCNAVAPSINDGLFVTQDLREVYSEFSGFMDMLFQKWSAIKELMDISIEPLNRVEEVVSSEGTAGEPSDEGVSNEMLQEFMADPGLLDLINDDPGFFDEFDNSSV